MIIVKEYSIREIPSGLKVVQGAKQGSCPDCGEPLNGYDRRQRSLIEDDGNIKIYLLRRLYCPRCERLHLEIPDIMQPQKHYASKVILQVMEGNKESCPADDSTIRRWKK